jgi:HD superfamily phosphohydrolase
LHLASRFVISAIENADEKTALEFFTQLEELDVFDNYNVALEDLDVLLTPDRRFGGGGLRATRVSFRDESLRSDRKYVRLLGLAEAGLRLAALFHDLGHLPFSHDFEYALKDYVAEGRPLSAELQDLASGSPHEKVGHKVADLVFQALIQGQSGINPATRAAFAMARKILNNEARYDDFPEPDVDVLGWLHSLVDGEIDVDRADYLLRDARALGLEFAIYDLERLIHNLVLVRHRAFGYITAVDERGLTSVETFYVARARSHQVLARHHKTAQLGAALRYSSVQALGSADGNGFLRELLKLDGGVSAIAARDLLNEFARHDDPWWLEVLRKQESTITEPLAAASLSLVLRRSPSFGSLWKRKGDLTAQELKVLNGALRSSEYAVHFEKARKELLKNGVLLTLHRFRPYSVPLGGDPAKDSVTLIRSGGSLTSVVLLSPLIRSLQTAWDEDLHVHAFGVTTGGITKAEVLGMLIPKHRAAKKSGMSQPSVRKKKRTRGSKRR